MTMSARDELSHSAQRCESHSLKELDISMKRYKREQILTLLRQIEVEIANGKTAPQVYKEA